MCNNDRVGVLRREGGRGGCAGGATDVPSIVAFESCPDLGVEGDGGLFEVRRAGSDDEFVAVVRDHGRVQIFLRCVGDRTVHSRSDFKVGTWSREIDVDIGPEVAGGGFGSSAIEQIQTRVSDLGHGRAHGYSRDVRRVRNRAVRSFGLDHVGGPG